MFHTILVPLDGSKLAERAVPAATAVAATPGARLLLLRVVPPLAMRVDPQLYEQLTHQREDEAAAYLRRIQANLAAAHVAADVRVVHGPVAETLLHIAQEEPIDLVVISSHGRSGLTRWVYGSVAEKLLHAPICPTLIIRAQVDETGFPRRHVLVPLDGSPLAEQALPPAQAVAQTIGARLTLVRVVQAAHLLIETQTMKQQADYLESLEESEAVTYLEQTADRLAKAGTAVSTHLLVGQAADAIIDYAAAHDVDLIVMSSHGRSGLERWVYGSVTEKVLRGATCATLIIRDA
ncbi:MAG: universal stress protein [Anaerolineales bacterium]|nr:universal stress protein [Anaerolineales bacterium]